MIATSYNPTTGTPVSTGEHTSPSEVQSLTRRAARAATSLKEASPAQRRSWLNALADGLDEARDDLVTIADKETALGVARLDGELAKTIAQTRFYGDVAVEGSYLGVALDDATDTTPALARVNLPLGPVAVFGASNFPFVLGALGHDTSAAIAAGCPVVAKAHSAYLGLSFKLADIARSTLKAAGAPDGIFDIVVGREAGVELVRAPETQAVAFTGSQSGGLALWEIANQRDIPIPVYAEMGTVNPIVVTPGGASDIDAVAAGFVATYTSSAGQYCSKPGLLFAPEESGAVEAVAKALRDASPAPFMLTAPIAASVRSGVTELQDAGAAIIEQIELSAGGFAAPAALLEVDLHDLTPGSRLLEECFGAVALVCSYRSIDEVHTALSRMQASLVAAVFTAPGDQSDPDVPALLQILGDKVGRIVLNGWTTGAAHSWAQNHGGPWPATSNASTTSIGAAALDRFVRPVTYQSIPDTWLSPAAQRANPWHVTQRINGVLEPSTADRR